MVRRGEARRGGEEAMRATTDDASAGGRRRPGLQVVEAGALVCGTEGRSYYLGGGWTGECGRIASERCDMIQSWMYIFLIAFGCLAS